MMIEEYRNLEPALSREVWEDQALIFGRGSRATDLPTWIDLGAEEHVLFHEWPDRRARLGAYVATLGLFELWRRRTHFIVTGRRIITVRGVISRDQQLVPLDKVDRVTLRPGRWSSRLDVATVGGVLGTQPFGPLGRQQAVRMAETIRRAREE
jgi:hypothetical protein